MAKITLSSDGGYWIETDGNVVDLIGLIESARIDMHMRFSAMLKTMQKTELDIPATFPPHDNDGQTA
jgi:hypothetical protein